MRRFGLLLLILLLSGACALGESSFVVVEEADDVPDPRVQARALMRTMTLEEKIYQLFVVEPEALTGEKRTTALSAEESYFAQYPVGGVVFFGQNIVSEEQLLALTTALRQDAADAGVYAPFLAVDEEGGGVSRVGNKLGYALAPYPKVLGDAGDQAGARAAGEHIAAYLSPLGINLNFAPVADVLVEAGPEIGKRSYGPDAWTVADLAAAMADGLRAGGVIPCYKHFPGHGAVSGNTHTGAAATRRTIEDMQETEWIPFVRGIQENVEMIMVSHLVARGVGDDVPASLSSTVIGGLLRQELGYDGVVVTDALRMSAITADYKPGTAAVRSLRAGADLLLLPASLSSAAQGVLDAVANGELPMERVEESVERILALKIQRGIIR